MKPKLNYARHKQTKELMFFRGAAPEQIAAPDEWAFHAVPDGVEPETFTPGLISEPPEARCARLLHVPRNHYCSTCFPVFWAHYTQRRAEVA